MLRQMPPTSFDDIPAARAASQQMMAEMKEQMPDIPGVTAEDRIVPGVKSSCSILPNI
jgi:hypothetical protein